MFRLVLGFSFYKCANDALAVLAALSIVFLWIRFYCVPLFWRIRGALYYKSERLELAVDAFERGASVSPRDAKLRLGCALARRRLGRLEESARDFAAASAAQPQDARIAIERAETLRLLGRVDEGIETLDAYLSSNGFSRAALVARCAQKLAARRYASAENDCDLLLGTSVNSARAKAHALRGVARLMQGRVAAAELDFETSYLIDPDASFERAHCAASFYRWGMFAETIRICDLTLKLDPKCAIGYFYRGLALRALGKTEEGDADCRRATELSPREIEAFRIKEAAK